jgi:hypothetical protein
MAQGRAGLPVGQIGHRKKNVITQSMAPCSSVRATKEIRKHLRVGEKGTVAATAFRPPLTVSEEIPGDEAAQQNTGVDRPWGLKPSSYEGQRTPMEKAALISAHR